VIEKSLNNIDDIEQCQKEAGLFMEQRDEEIWVPDRPENMNHMLVGTQSKENDKSYILNRFMSAQRSASPDRAALPTIKSMQHFFLKVSLL